MVTNLLKEITGILLGKEGGGTLKATWCGGSWELSLGFFSPGFWAEIEGHLGFADQGGLRCISLANASQKEGCSVASSRPAHQVGRAAVGWRSKHQERRSAPGGGVHPPALANGRSE